MSLTSYRAAPPRDQGRKRALPGPIWQVYSKRVYAITNPVAGQFQKLQSHPLVYARFSPVAAGKGKIGRARIKSQFRRIMLKCLQRAPRMIPRRDQDRAVNIFRAQ